LPRHSPKPAQTAHNDEHLAAAVAAWFSTAARPLPWRPVPLSAPRDPYHALVSEFMLQQTQVSRVLEKFGSFVASFPSVSALAAAPESAVLAAWSGLGYYRRARLLHAAAKTLIDQHRGAVPSDPAALRELPGVGRYTAGSIASIVFRKHEPIVDGNVARVLLRIEGREQTAAEAADHLWTRAAALARAAPDPALFNEGLMELGALVCTPKAPRCDSCPVATSCRAKAQGRVDRIPTPKTPARVRSLTFHTLVVVDARGRVLLEQRPDKGLWAGMWQPPTVELDGSAPRESRPEGLPDEPLLEFSHQTTHRRVQFLVWLMPKPARTRLVNRPTARWTTPQDWPRLGLSNPVRRILAEIAPTVTREARPAHPDLQRAPDAPKAHRETRRNAAPPRRARAPRRTPVDPR
jgi:A/G-specific adenine glycosylase